MPFFVLLFDVKIGSISAAAALISSAAAELTVTSTSSLSFFAEFTGISQQPVPASVTIKGMLISYVTV